MKKFKTHLFNKCILTLALVLAFTFVVGQVNFGIPDIRNYVRSEYNAGSQNWGIAQAENGIIYIGNNEGLLAYDGNKWSLYTLPQKENVRSLAVDKNRIYIGGQGELGYFEPDLHGILQYHSLNARIPSNFRHDFAEVWNVVVIDKQIFFRSNRHVFIYENGQIKSYQSYNWSFLGKIGNKIWAYDDAKGLCQYHNQQWEIAIGKERLPANIQISSLLAYGTEIWIFTSNNGIYKWRNGGIEPFVTPTIDNLKKSIIAGAFPISSTQIAIATNLNGCFLIDTLGNYVSRFTYKEGLQSNNVICGFLDKNQNLWLGLDDGIDVIESNKPIRKIDPSAEGPVSGYASAVYKDYLFLGTSIGLYRVKYSMQKGIQLPFEKLPKASGQIWSLTTIEDQLWIGHNKAAMVYESGEVSSINRRSTGFWNFQSLPQTDYIIAGTYNGLHYFQKKGKSIIDVGIEALFESAKYVAIDDKKIWVIHPYKGLYRIDLSANGLPVHITNLGETPFLSSTNNHLFKIGNRIVITSDKGIFEWDKQKGTFIPSTFFIQIFGNVNIEYLKENGKGEYWFVQNGRLGVAKLFGTKYQISFIPELNGRLQFGDYQHIQFLNDSCLIIAAEKGFFYLNYDQYQSYEKDFNVLIRSFKIQTPKQDSILYGGYAVSGMKVPQIAYRYNSVLFTYSVPVFGFTSSMQYSYRLEGFDPMWSAWSDKTDKNYTNLPPGKYIFHVKARSKFSGIEKEVTFEFVVLAPWYRTNIAYVLYCLILLASVYLFSMYQHRRYVAIQMAKLAEQEKEYQKKQRELELQYNLEQEQKEKQLAKITNEKLAIELEMKNTAIASNAMLLVQKGELLSKVKRDLTSLLDISKEEKPIPQIRKIIRTVDAELNNKEDWDKFSSHFDTVHENYLKRLKESYPQLTYSDLKLCALLRLGMSSKEIAGILNISLKGVEVSRYRLRKKLQMDEDQSLFDFLATK